MRDFIKSADIKDMARFVFEPKLRFANHLPAILMCLALSIQSPELSANVAGSVNFAFGNATVEHKNGSRESLRKGMQISEGDTVQTGSRGLAQLRFTDGSFISVQKSSSFRIDEYAYTEPQGEEGLAEKLNKGFFSLLSGGFRTVTGLLNSEKKYRIKTPVATIGIRGTEYFAELGNSLMFSVAGGAIQICNNTGCQFFRENEFGHIEDNNSIIERIRDMGLDAVVSDEDGTTVENSEADEDFRFGIAEDVDENGEVDILVDVIPPPVIDPDPDPIIPVVPSRPDCSSGNCTSVFGYGFEGSFGAWDESMISGSFNATTDVLESYADGTSISPDFISDDPGSSSIVESSGANDEIAWGRWVGGLTSSGYTDIHYAIGTPTPDISSLSGTASFSVLGFSTATTNGSALGSFTGITGGSLGVDFDNVQVTSLGFTSNFANGSFIASTLAPIPIDPATSTFSVTGLTDLSVTGSGAVACATFCDGFIHGFVAGANGNHVGVGYNLFDQDSPTPNNVVGVIVFNR